jgi:RNA 2',3'-cyclic 3'-phosphodiesterase
MIRTFIGIRVAPEVGQTLDHWEGQMQSVIDAKRWYGIDQYHITVHFLGDQTPSQLAEIDVVCQEVAKSVPCFSLELASIGLFERARVIWAGVKGEIAVLQYIYKQLQPILNIAKSNTFVRPKLIPHITLGRLRTIPSKQEMEVVRKRIEQLEYHETAWNVSQIERFESVSTPFGVQYPTRMVYPLRK